MPCSCCSYDEVFDEKKQARRDAKRYRRKGLDKAARRVPSRISRAAGSPVTPCSRSAAASARSSWSC